MRKWIRGKSLICPPRLRRCHPEKKSSHVLESNIESIFKYLGVNKIYDTFYQDFLLLKSSVFEANTIFMFLSNENDH